LSCQRYFGGIEKKRSLHVGDQFLSVGANDFKVCDLPARIHIMY
jgi:IMP and pyridine-specific 5'-nucleotidase